MSLLSEPFAIHLSGLQPLCEALAIYLELLGGRMQEAVSVLGEVHPASTAALTLNVFFAIADKSATIEAGYEVCARKVCLARRWKCCSTGDENFSLVPRVL